MAEDPRSPLVGETRVLLHRVVEAIAEAKTHNAHSRSLLEGSRERLVWSDCLIGESATMRDRLQDTVSALAGIERAKGVSPEKMLVLLKELIVDADRDKLSAMDARSLMDDVVRWGIEGYYAA
jgi:phage terminase large subunit-like protein